MLWTIIAAVSSEGIPPIIIQPREHLPCCLQQTIPSIPNNIFIAAANVAITAKITKAIDLVKPKKIRIKSKTSKLSDKLALFAAKNAAIAPIMHNAETKNEIMLITKRSLYFFFILQPINLSCSVNRVLCIFGVEIRAYLFCVFGSKHRAAHNDFAWYVIAAEKLHRLLH